MESANKSALSFTIFKTASFSRLLLEDLWVLISSRILNLCYSSKKNEQGSKEIVGQESGLNICTGLWKISGKTLIYVRRKLLHNGHSCPAGS